MWMIELTTKTKTADNRMGSHSESTGTIVASGHREDGGIRGAGGAPTGE
jgi:hypothetical protein